MKRATICLLVLGLAACSSKSNPAPDSRTADQPRNEPAAARLGSSAPAGEPQSASGKTVEPTLHESVEYDDAGTQRTLWVSEDLVAEFAPTPGNLRQMQHADPGARPLDQPQAGVRIWRLSSGISSKEFARRNSTAAMRLSPVLHEGPNPAQPMRALPGGVVATFPANWDRAHVELWLRKLGLRLDGDVVVAEANMYLVATPPGLESLRIAGVLVATGELTDVAPNFWRQNAAR